MKRIILIGALAFSTVAFAQTEGDKIEKIKVTKTTVEDGSGESTLTKKKTVTSKRKVKLEPSDEGQVNQSLAKEDFKTRTDVIYSYDDSNYKMEKEGKGFNFLMVDGSKEVEKAKLRKLSTDGYIFRNNDETAYAHFDEDGNLIVETYDYENDTITVKKYSVSPEGDL